MAKAKAAKKDNRGRLQRIIDREAAAANVAPEPNPFTRQHGSYERVHGIDGDGHLNMRPHMNRGGTPIARWKAAGLLTESQQAAIAHCIRLWEIVSSSGKLVANLDRTVFGVMGDGHPMEIEARMDLARMSGGNDRQGNWEPGYIPPKYWSVFENVVRFDEPAGVAGSKLETAKCNREHAARMTVQFVSDVIAMKERLSY